MTYDEWFKAKVKEAMMSEKPASKHADVIARLRASIK